MLKIRNILLPILGIVLCGVLLPNTANAAQIHTGDYVLDRETVIEEDLYLSGENIVIRGVVDGDLFISGKTVTLDGTITGDTYIIGNTVNISGNIYGNVIAIGYTLNVNGTLGQNVYLTGMMTNIDATIGQDLFIASGTVKLSGTVGDDVRIAGGQITSDAQVSGDFLLSSESYNVMEQNIAGQLMANTKNIRIGSLLESSRFNITTADILGFNLGLALISFLGMYIVGLLLIYAAPVKTLQIEKKVITSFEEALKSFAIGLLVLFAVPLPLFLLTLTMVGAPLAFLIFGILIFLVVFGTLWVESAIGQKILVKANYKENNRYLSLFVGRLITTLVRLIPIVGGIYSLSLTFITVGAVVRVKYDALEASKRKGDKKK
jgi:hypothetical protein